MPPFSYAQHNLVIRIEDHALFLIKRIAKYKKRSRRKEAFTSYFYKSETGGANI